MSGEGKSNNRRVTSLEDLIFYTDTDTTEEYPLYILPNFTIQYKRKPSEYILEFIVNVEKLNDVSISMDEASKNDEYAAFINRCPLEEIKNVQEITKKDVYIDFYRVKYECYTKDGYLGDFTAHAVEFFFKSPYSGIKGEGRRAWAIAYGWKERFLKKYHESKIKNRIYVKGSEGKRGRAYVYLIVKIPLIDEVPEAIQRAFAQPVRPKEKEFEITEELKEKLLPSWLWRGYLLVTNFVTERRGAETFGEIINKNGVEMRREGVLFERVKLRLRNFRALFYQQFAREYTVPTVYGLVFHDFNDEIREELQEWLERYRSILREVFPNVEPESLQVVEIYVPRKIIVSELDKYISKLRADLENVRKKIEELESEEGKDEEEKKKVKQKLRSLYYKEDFIQRKIRKVVEMREKIAPTTVPMELHRVKALLSSKRNSK